MYTLIASESKSDNNEIKDEYLEVSPSIDIRTENTASNDNMAEEKSLKIAEPKAPQEARIEVSFIDEENDDYKSYLDSAKELANNPYVRQGAYFAGCALITIYSGPLLAVATRAAFPTIIYPAMTGAAMPSLYSVSYWAIAVPLREQVCANVCLNGPAIISTVTATAPIVYTAAKSAASKGAEIYSAIKHSQSCSSFFSPSKVSEASKLNESELDEKRLSTLAASENPSPNA